MAYTNSANGYDYTKQKKWDNELSRFRDMESQGINPIGTTHAEMDRSEIAIENKTAISDAITRGDF